MGIYDHFPEMHLLGQTMMFDEVAWLTVFPVIHSKDH